MLQYSRKQIFLISLFIFLYFCVLFLNSYVFHMSSIIGGIIQELLTLPFLGAQLFILVISAITVVKNGWLNSRMPFFTLLVSMVNVIIVLGSIIGAWL